MMSGALGRRPGCALDGYGRCCCADEIMRAHHRRSLEAVIAAGALALRRAPDSRAGARDRVQLAPAAARWDLKPPRAARRASRSSNGIRASCGNCAKLRQSWMPAPLKLYALTR